MQVAEKAKEAGESAERKGNRVKMPFTQGRLGLVEFFKESFAQASKDHLGAFAGNLTYAALFALFPFIIFLLSLLAIFHATNLVHTLLQKASQTLPANMVGLIGTQLKRIATTKATGAFTAGAIAAILGALWGVSGAFRGVMEALNVMYNVEESRPFVKKYGVSILLSLMTSALLVAAGVLVVAGPAISNYIARVTGSGRLFVILWEVLQWPVLVVVVLMAFALMYYFAPNVKQEFEWITPGAAIALFFWLLYTLLFSLYVNNVGGHSYSATYGALAGIAIFMIYIHQTAYFFLLGAEMNQVIETHIPDEEGARGGSGGGAPPGPALQPSGRSNLSPIGPGRAVSPSRPTYAEAQLGRKVLAAGAAAGLAGMIYRWFRRSRR
ncbi:MAG: rane protein [Actinomycetota bacterium]|jgi:membrane protein|nr:rane protein [Actinomycetota bacterium]